MEKLPMCRICLAQNVRMYIVVDRNLHELYEKLTHIPFVTEDRRPILACFLCFSKLKQCWRLFRKCLESDEQFVKIMKEDYEPDAFINLDCFELYSGLNTSPIQHMSTVDECHTENNYITIKQELPAVCEGLDEFIEIEEEHHSDELEPDNLYQSSPEVDVDIPPQHSESDSEDDKPLIEIETEEVEEEEVYKMEANATETKKIELDNFHQSSLEAEVDIPPQHSKSDSDVDHLMEIGSEMVEEEEVNKTEANATETKTEKQGLETQTTILEDPLTTKETAKKQTTNVIRKTQRLAKRGAYFNAPYKCDQGTQKNEKLMYYVMERTRKSNLTEYILVHTDDKLHKCGVCERSFSQKAHLQRHTLVHTGEKPFKCDVCQRGLSDKAALRHHIRNKHTGEKPYKCDVCERSFSMKAALRKHISSHTPEKPYKCNVCKLSFSQNFELKKHVRLRTCEAPFKCNICERGFGIRSNLMRHIFIHSGEKPFKCDVCQRCFNQKSLLTDHIRIHTGEKPFKCPVCQRSFRHKCGLRQHLRRHNKTK